MGTLRPVGGLLAAAMVLLGCAAGPPPISGEVGERSEAMALTRNLLDQNKDVAGILAIKSVSAETKTLVLEIAAACREALSTIDRIATREGLRVDDDGLPVAERRVRAAIRARMTRELLTSFGRAFERNLLLSQVEGLGYASNLLEEVAAQLRKADRNVEALEHEATRFAALRARVIRRLEVVDG